MWKCMQAVFIIPDIGGVPIRRFLGAPSMTGVLISLIGCLVLCREESNRFAGLYIIRYGMKYPMKIKSTALSNSKTERWRMCRCQRSQEQEKRQSASWGPKVRLSTRIYGMGR